MNLLVLPVIIVASQEAIRAVPLELQDASYGIGGTKWQTIVRVVLLAAIPVFIAFLTQSIFATFTVCLCKFITRDHVHKVNSNI